MQHETATPFAHGLHKVLGDEFHELMISIHFRAALTQPEPSTRHTLGAS